MANLVDVTEIEAAAQRLWTNSETIATRCMEIQQIPAPTGHEAKRAAWVMDVLRDMGYAGVEQDALCNVYVRVPGKRADPGVLVSAHLDTVFAAGTDLTLHRERRDDRIYGPGIGDNSTGVAALILLVEVLQQLPKPPVDIWLVANSGEEGLGDLRGMREVFNRLGEKIGACIVIEGMGLGRLVHRALGSRRYRIRVNAPGGHSWSDFGTASAIHVLVQIAQALVQMPTPAAPRTTFNIGRIKGGRSVNTIAQVAELELDLRSEDGDTLASMVQQVEMIVAQYERPHWKQRNVQITLEEIGNRPAGAIADDHPLVKHAIAALRKAGYDKQAELRISSTDANIPLSRGIPAVCIGITDGGNAHRLEEWIRSAPLPTGMRQLLLLTWTAAEWLAEEA